MTGTTSTISTISTGALVWRGRDRITGASGAFITLGYVDVNGTCYDYKGYDDRRGLSRGWEERIDRHNPGEGQNPNDWTNAPLTGGPHAPLSVLAAAGRGLTRQKCNETERSAH